MQNILFVLISILVFLIGGVAPCEVPANKGRVTGLDIPRFVSYRIDWVLEKSGLPLKIIGEHNHWRQVEDFEGDRGWVYFRLLSGKRTVITTQKEIFLRKKIGKDTKPVAILGFGLIGQLIKVDQNSCQAIFQKYKGWVDKENVWGC